MSNNVLEQLHQLNRAGEPVALATVVRVETPISAKPGDKALITPDGALRGWVGGGCAQDIVVREAKKVLADGHARFLRLVGSGASVSERSEGVLEFPITCHSGGTMDVFIEPVLPRPQLILLGSSPVALALARLARVVDFEVDVFDPAATREQFPDVERLSNDFDLSSLEIRPLSFAVIATQGHDDEVALEMAARSRVPFVAFVASRKKLASRVAFLREQGLGDAQLARIKAPAGLDIGAVTPEEIAASILAELVQVRRRQWPSMGAAVAVAVPAPAAEAVDPVCGMTVAIATARYTSEYRGQMFYFCAAGCKSAFDKNPSEYVTR